MSLWHLNIHSFLLTNLKACNEEKMNATCFFFFFSISFTIDCKDINPKGYQSKILNFHWKDWCWSWSSNMLATWCEELTHGKRCWRWVRLKVGEKGTTDNQRVEWHQEFNGQESEKTPKDSEGQGSLVFCGPWDYRVGHNWATEYQQQMHCIQRF